MSCLCLLCGQRELQHNLLRQETVIQRDRADKAALELHRLREELRIAQLSIARLTTERDALEAREPDVDKSVAAIAEVLAHEIPYKLHVELTPQRATDLARQAVHAVIYSAEAA